MSAEWIGAIERGDITDTDRKIIVQHLHENADLRQQLAALQDTFDQQCLMTASYAKQLASERRRVVEEAQSECRDLSVNWTKQAEAHSKGSKSRRMLNDMAMAAMTCANSIPCRYSIRALADPQSAAGEKP